MNYFVLGILFLGTVLADVPLEWKFDYENGHFLYVFNDGEVDRRFLPQIGNGFLSTQLMSEDVFVAGLYNGDAKFGPSQRARIPSTLNYRAPGYTTHSGLHLREATYYRRSYVTPYKLSA